MKTLQQQRSGIRAENREIPGQKCFSYPGGINRKGSIKSGSVVM